MERGFDFALDMEPDLGGVFADSIHRRAADKRIPNDAAGRVARPGLELRLHERHDVAPWRHLGRDPAQHVRQGNEGDVNRRERGWFGDSKGIRVGGIEPTGVRPLHRDHARIGAQGVGQLSAPHVESIDAARAAPQQTVGEATGRCSDIEADASRRIDAKGVERGRELLAAAGDERRALDELDRGRGIDEIAGLPVGPGSVTAPDPDPAGEQERLRL